MTGSQQFYVLKQLSSLYPDKIIQVPKLCVPKHLRLKHTNNNIQASTHNIHIALKHKSYFESFDFNNKTRQILPIKGDLPHNPFSHHFHNHTFDNQRNFGKAIQMKFAQKHILHTLAIAPTQSGKTGSMIATCFHMLQHKDTYVPPQHIFVFTAHSSRDWLEQTKHRFPDFMANNIYHRNQLTALIQAIQHKQNVLLILDEVHIAAKPGQSIYQLFSACNFFDLDYNFANNIKIISFTATPNVLHQHFTHTWQSAHYTIHMDVPTQYVGMDNLIAQNRLFINHDLCGFDNDSQSVKPQTFIHICDYLHKIDLSSSPKFHIIRTHRGVLHRITIKNFALTLQKHFKHIPTSLISEPKQTNFDFDSFIQNAPHKHTFIFIIDKLRCAKSLKLTHVGSLYERHVHKPNFEAIHQGLLGRCSGFHPTSHTLCFSQFHVQLQPFKHSFAKIY